MNNYRLISGTQSIMRMKPLCTHHYVLPKHSAGISCFSKPVFTNELKGNVGQCLTETELLGH